jgi:hypothetical protein
MGEVKNAHNVSNEEPDGKRSLWRPIACWRLILKRN